mmetsp:Transcript_81507/g.186571  ORF Transcript_81507/g.186571 Transcript_81507/m.186571 type:complete len:221 (+) Transcript_81507:732-1394(+)
MSTSNHHDKDQGKKVHTPVPPIVMADAQLLVRATILPNRGGAGLAPRGAGAAGPARRLRARPFRQRLAAPPAGFVVPVVPVLLPGGPWALKPAVNRLRTARLTQQADAGPPCRRARSQLLVLGRLRARRLRPLVVVFPGLHTQGQLLNHLEIYSVLHEQEHKHPSQRQQTRGAEVRQGPGVVQGGHGVVGHPAQRGATHAGYCSSSAQPAESDGVIRATH